MEGCGESARGWEAGPVTSRRSVWDDHETTCVDGTVVHAAVAGSADLPTVVLVHGHGSSHRYFQPLARALSGSARVVAVDLPGFGRTEGPPEALGIRGLSQALAAWLAATGRGGSVMVGNSVGCQVLVDVAVHSPGLLGPLVLDAPTVDAGSRRRRSAAWRQGVDLFLEAPGLPWVQLRDFVACGPRRFMATLDDVIADRVEDKVHLVPTPTVVVRGRLDPLVPRAWAELLVAGLPDGRLVDVPMAPHAMNWSRPFTFAAIVREVLAST